MEVQGETMARVDRLSDLPEPILLHILSMLPCKKQIVRTSVLSTRWRFLWMSVPVSLVFRRRHHRSTKYFMTSICRDLIFWSSCNSIRALRFYNIKYRCSYDKHFDFLVHFATKVANVEDFTLEMDCNIYQYVFPPFAYKNTSLRNLVLDECVLDPSGSVNWSSLVSLSIGNVSLTDGVMEKVLSGSPNLECLKLGDCWDLHHLEISSVKLRKLILRNHATGSLEILAPYIEELQLLGFCLGIFPRNVPSLVTAVIHLDYDFKDHLEDKMEEECSYLKELLHTVAHVENLELSPWCIEFIYVVCKCLSALELEGWQSPPSNRKFLKLHTALELLDFPGICRFLQSSSYLVTLVIDWSNHIRVDLLSSYTNKDVHRRRFETHNFNYSLLHLKTIKIINYHGSLSENEFIRLLVKYFLKNATVLEEFVIDAEGSDLYEDYDKMEQEFLSFPRSSPLASVVFYY